MSDVSDRFIEEAALNDAQAARERNTPFAIFRPSLSVDGDRWCALYGKNLQEGIAGFGASPALAAEAFDAAWYAKLPAAEAKQADAAIAEKRRDESCGDCRDCHYCEWREGKLCSCGNGEATSETCHFPDFKLWAERKDQCNK